MIQLENIKLDRGHHKTIEEGACVMEMVSYIANESWSDKPACACPVLTAFAIATNDTLNDEYRQKLVPLIPKLAGSRSSKEVEKKRCEFFALQVVTVFLPLLTASLGLQDVSAKLRSFEDGEWKEMEKYCREQVSVIGGADDAAAYAVATAAAYAADTAADAADTAADAADAADTAADAATAAAYAANAAAAAYVTYVANKARHDFWLGVRNQTWDAMIAALTQACEIS